MVQMVPAVVLFVVGVHAGVPKADGAEPARLAAAGASPSFNREVRPILSDKCFFCHGPDKAKRKSGLRLDDRQAAIDAGAIVPGDVEGSALWQRIVTEDPDDLMPPPDAHKSVTAEEMAVLRRWLQAGAPYEPHWSYVPVKRPAVAKGRAAAIDAYIEERLAKERLPVSPTADARTRLRRLSLDLTGLPPTPRELAAFENDKSANAWERQVDRLLASPQFGERMAVPWLDVVRFADTVGYHGDQNQNIFPYRDYVIAAFNSNKRFDQFTLEQVAGDLLPKPTTQQLVASGFNRLNMVTREGGAQAAEYLAKYMADRVRAVGTAFLGSTLGCAQCHDHKYDPIELRDFYAMGAFFSDIREWGIYMDYPYTPNKDLAGFTNDHPFPPEMTVESPFLKQHAKHVQQEKTGLWRQLEALATQADRKQAFTNWVTRAQAFLSKHPQGWQPLTPKVRYLDEKLAADVDGQGTVVLRQISAGTPGKHRDVLLEVTGLSGTFSSIRLDLVPHPQHGGSHLRDGALDNRLQVSARVDRGEDKMPLRFADAFAPVHAPAWKNGRKQPNLLEGWQTPRGHFRDRLTAVWELESPINLLPEDKLVLKVTSNAVGAFAVSASPFAGLAAQKAPGPWGPAEQRDKAHGEPTQLAKFLSGLLARGPQHWTAADKAALAQVWTLSGGTADAALLRQLYDVHQRWLSVREGTAETLVTVAQTPRVTRILPRGNWQDESGDVVAPAVPHFLPQLPASATNGGRRATRLDLARWLVSRENPLTARAFVNRLWKQFFGTGLSAVLDDLGGQGEPPTHPELLDWLAAEFMDSGWNVKHMVKLMVMSRTYQQDSTARQDLLAKDPQNRLLARQSQRRLDAEFVRDNALFVSGLLNLSLGGPSAFPYQPDGHYDNLEFPLRTYVADGGALQHRRGVYTHWQRTFLHPMMANFDAPSRDECAADRPYSNTPQQALTLLNDRTFVEAARAFGSLLLQGSAKRSVERRISDGFERATGRLPDKAELDRLVKLLDAEQKHFASHPDEAARLVGGSTSDAAQHAPSVPMATRAAWTSLARVLLNFYETITRV